MSCLNLNKVVLAGRLTADPELKQTQSGISVVSFTIAVNRKYSKEQQQTDFISVIAWRQTAEFISRYFKKGSAICITGAIQTRSWQDQQGQKRYATEVIADEAMFVDSKSDNQPAANGASAPGTMGYVPEAYASTAPKFEEIPPDEDLPF